jgi:cyclophilin family peptidyl-prolyl cis-trans isomerase
MMRKSTITRGSSNVGSTQTPAAGNNSNSNLHASAGNLSYNHMTAPTPPLSPRKAPIVRNFKMVERKDSNEQLFDDLSEGDESLTIGSCFDRGKDNNENDSFDYNNGNGSGVNGNGQYIANNGKIDKNSNRRVPNQYMPRRSRRGNKALPSLSITDNCPQSCPTSLQQLQHLHLRPVWIIVLVGVCVISFCAVALFFFEKYEDSHDAAIRLQMRMEEIGPLSMEMQGKLSAIESENQKLKSKLEQEEVEIGTLRKRTSKELPTLQQKVERLEAYKNQMRDSIQKMSKQRLIEKYGPGPHKVEVQLAFDPDSLLEGTADRIVLELAPVEFMPHTVYWFLEQVHHGLYDKCAFHRNANHVIQAGPVGNHLTAPNEGLLKKFIESGFGSVLFQEYSNEYKHYKYTLGLAGRPGGPDFYINMKDNDRLHGPGGQIGSDADDADPCFARVVEGFDAVARMHQSDIDEDGGYRHMRHNVAIKYMRLLPVDYKPLSTR